MTADLREGRKKVLDVKCPRFPDLGIKGDHYYLVGIDQPTDMFQGWQEVLALHLKSRKKQLFILLSALKAEAAIASVAVVAAADFPKFRMILTFSWIARRVRSFWFFSVGKIFKSLLPSPHSLLSPKDRTENVLQFMVGKTVIVMIQAY